MSEYQYYEFCSVRSPLSAQARKEMYSLSSRAKVSTHGATYVYNYGNFRGNAKQLLLKYFDVFFYIANWGTVELMFKYPAEKVDVSALKKLAIKHVVDCQQRDENVVLTVHVNNEEGFGWTEGEGLLPNLLSLYDEIKNQDYQWLHLVSVIQKEFAGEQENALSDFLSTVSLSSTQQAFLDAVGIGYKVG